MVVGGKHINENVRGRNVKRFEDNKTKTITFVLNVQMLLLKLLCSHIQFSTSEPELQKLKKIFFFFFATFALPSQLSH